MSKTRMIFYGALGSLVSVLIWSFIGGCHTSTPDVSVPPPAEEIAPEEIVPAAEISEETLVEEGIITADQPAAPVEPEVVPDQPAAKAAEPVPKTAVASLETPSPRLHKVEKGETLWGISRQYGVSLDSIVQANQLDNPDRLSLGQELVIPDSSD